MNIAGELTSTESAAEETYAHPRRPTGIFVVSSLLVLATVILAARLFTADEPIECDLTTYAVFGHEMLRGRTLYTDLWNNYTPANFVTYAAAELLVGYGSSQFLFLGLLTSLATLLGVYTAAAFGPGGRAAG